MFIDDNNIVNINNINNINNNNDLNRSMRRSLQRNSNYQIMDIYETHRTFTKVKENPLTKLRKVGGMPCTHYTTDRASGRNIIYIYIYIYIDVKLCEHKYKPNKQSYENIIES